MSASTSTASTGSSVSTDSANAALQNLQDVYNFATTVSSEITVVKVQGDVVLDATKQRPNV